MGEIDIISIIGFATPASVMMYNPLVAGCLAETASQTAEKASAALNAIAAQDEVMIATIAARSPAAAAVAAAVAKADAARKPVAPKIAPREEDQFSVPISAFTARSLGSAAALACIVRAQDRADKAAIERAAAEDAEAAAKEAAEAVKIAEEKAAEAARIAETSGVYNWFRGIWGNLMARWQ